MAKGFVFRLQPVLEQREREERDRQLAVAAIERERLECEERLRAVQRALVEARGELRSGLHPGAGEGGRAGNMEAVRRVAGESLHLTLRGQRVAMELAGILKRLEAARGVLIRAAAARKAVQLLKDRALEEHRRAMMKREMADLDEMAVMRHARAGDMPGASADRSVA